MLPTPARVKYINLSNQKRERIWASRVSDHKLYEVTMEEKIAARKDKCSQCGGKIVPTDHPFADGMCDCGWYYSHRSDGHWIPSKIANGIF